MPANALRLILLGAVLWALVTSGSHACSVPVFRYALERWAPDPFEAVVFHRGELEPEQRISLAALKESAANLHVVTVDLDGEGDALRRTQWEEQDTETLPWLYVTYPESHPVAVELASGPLEPKLVQAVLDAPTRKAVAEELVTGRTAVWILLKSGNEPADEAAWQTLESSLAMLEDTLELPDIEQEDIDAGLLSVDEDSLKISFSARSVERVRPEDEMLVRMLLDTEEDLLDLSEPMVFPVFGRGRVLHALIGEGITPANLKATASYLVGACSCQVKADNPGVDLLVSMDWNSRVETTMEEDRPLPELAGILPEPPESQRIQPSAAIRPEVLKPGEEPAVTVEESGSGRMLWTTLASLLVMLLVVAAGSAFWQRDEKASQPRL